MTPTLVFLLLDPRGHQPFPIQGARVTYATAHYDPKNGGHVFRMKLDEWVKCGKDIVRGFSRPLCSFMPVDVELPQDFAAVIEERDELRRRLLAYEPPPKPRDEWTHREWIAHAKKIGMPRAQILARNGNKAAYRKIVEEYEAATTPSAEGPAPSTEGAQTAATH